MRENKTFLLELEESLLIMRDKPSLNRPSNKIFVGILFAFNNCYVILIDFFLFFMFKYMSSTVRVNGTVKLIAILVP